MTTLLLVLSHVATACLFAYLGYRFAPRVVESVEHHLEHPEETPMADPTPPPQTTELSTGVVILIASFMVIVIGVMSGWFIIDGRHKAELARHQAACTVQWGNDLLDAISDRQEVSKKLRRKERTYDTATAGRDRALNAIIDLVLRQVAHQPPPPPLPQDPQEAFPIVLNDYAAASRVLEDARARDAVRAELNNDVKTKPYPVLDTGCKLREDSAR